MSRANKPRDNAVVERFIKTLKAHKINDRTLQEQFFPQIKINSKFKGYRKIFNLCFFLSQFVKPNSQLVLHLNLYLDKSKKKYFLFSRIGKLIPTTKRMGINVYIVYLFYQLIVRINFYF